MFTSGRTITVNERDHCKLVYRSMSWYLVDSQEGSHFEGIATIQHKGALAEDFESFWPPNWIDWRTGSQLSVKLSREVKVSRPNVQRSHYTLILVALFVSASNQTGLDTRSMTRRSVIVGVKGGGGRVRAKTLTLLDYADYYCPPEGGPAEAGDLLASNLSLTLNTAWLLWPCGHISKKN